MENQVYVLLLPGESSVGEFSIFKHDDSDNLFCGYKTQEHCTKGITTQHLYFLNEEDIKDGDYYHYQHFGGDVIERAHSKSDFENLNKPDRFFKKVVAATDNKLDYLSVTPISREFIVHYAEQNNNGDTIESIVFEKDGSATMKINSEMQILSPIKNSWSRDEVIELIKKFEAHDAEQKDTDAWIHENLK